MLLASVIRNIPLLKDGIYGKPGDACDSAENSCNSADLTAVVKNALHRSGKSLSGSYGAVQDQHIFSVNHRLYVVTENHLSHTVIFRGSNINGLVCVHGKNPRLGQFFCKWCFAFLDTVFSIR